MADYRTAVESDPDKDDARPRGKAIPLDQAGYWWRADKSKAHDAVNAAVTALRSDQRYRTAENLRHVRMYGNFDSMGFGLREVTRSSTPTSHVNKIAWNVVAGCSDTLTAKIAKNKPRPLFQTEGGQWSLQRKAKLLDKFVQGVSYEMGLPQINQQCFLDACVVGTGSKKFYIDPATGRICCERVLVEELLVDDSDGYYGKPRQLFQTKAVAREIALDRFAYVDGKKSPEAGQRAAAILAARPAEMIRGKLRDFGDMIPVHEAWHLPSSDASDDGRHVICIEGLTLLDEPWEQQYFPFTFLRIFPRLIGFWGQGVAERLMGIQLEINRLLRSVSEQLQRKGRGRIFLPIGSKVVASHMTNGIGDIVYFSGQQPPIVDASNAVAPEEFQQLMRLRESAYEEVGVSEMNATAQKPAGLDSQPSLREYNDINTERFALIGQAYEQVCGVDDARIIVDMTREWVEEHKGRGYSVQVPGKRFIDKIDWSEAGLDNEKFYVKTYPVSSLPNTPAAKRQEVQELLDQGFISDKAEALRLMDMPDLENMRSLATAALDDVDGSIDNILDEKVTESKGYRSPEKTQNLQLIISRGTAAYLYARRDGCPEGPLALLMTFIDQAAALIAQAKQEEMAAQAAAMPPPGPPGGGGMPALMPGAPPPGAPPMPVLPQVPSGPQGAPPGLIQ